MVFLVLLIQTVELVSNGSVGGVKRATGGLWTRIENILPNLGLESGHINVGSSDNE